MSDLRVRIKDEPWLRSVAIYIIRGEDVVQILHHSGEPGELIVPTWDIVSEGVEAAPTFRVKEEEARGLLEALVRHYQGAEDTRTLRKDYDAERARVDKFIEHLTRRGE